MRPHGTHQGFVQGSGSQLMGLKLVLGVLQNIHRPLIEKLKVNKIFHWSTITYD